MLADAVVKKLREALETGAVEAIGITGSYARGTETRYSDVDVYCLSDEPPKDVPGYNLRVIGEHLVSVTRTTFGAKRADFGEPDSAIWAVPGLRQMQIISDAAGKLAALKQEAEDWRWTDVFQAKADDFASRELAGYAEEAHKVLGGLLKGDASTQLYGTYGLTLGLSRIVLVQGGVLLETENAYFQQAQERAGLNSAWTKHFRRATGFDTLPEKVHRKGRISTLTPGSSPSWRGGKSQEERKTYPYHPTFYKPFEEKDGVRMRAQAGLQLYCETEALLHAIIKPEHKTVIDRALRLIKEQQGHEGSTSPITKD